jgi:hypothetical protein
MIQPDTTTTDRTPPPMTTEDMLTAYLQLANDAVAELQQLPVGTERYDAGANTVIVSFTVTALLAELHAIDPDRADALASRIVDALTNADTVTDLVVRWSRSLNDGQPFTLAEVEHADDGETDPVVDTRSDEQAQRAEWSRMVHLLNTLAAQNRPRADELWRQVNDPNHPLTAAQVIAEIEALLRHVASSTPYQPPQRGPQH